MKKTGKTKNRKLNLFHFLLLGEALEIICFTFQSPTPQLFEGRREKYEYIATAIEF